MDATQGRIVIYKAFNGDTYGALVNQIYPWGCELTVFYPQGPKVVTSVQQGTDTGQWDWMEYQKGQAAKTEELQIQVDRVPELKRLLEVQGADGNWNFDPYMHGMYNGIECALAILEAREPAYKNAPKVWISDKVVQKDLGITEVRGAKANISDLVVYGDGDTFALLCKASSQSQGWMKSTKVCNVANGCIVQVTTQQRNLDGSYAVAEAVTFVPNMNIDINSEPRKLVRL